MTATLIATHVTRLKELLAKKGVSLADLVRTVDAAQAEITPPKPYTGPLPKKVTVSPTDVVTLSRFATLAESAEWPTERRELTELEKNSLLHLLVAEKTLKALVERVEKSLKPAIFNHLDVQAERTGAANQATPRHKDGYYILDGEVTIEGLGYKATRETRAGTVSLTAEDLAQLENEGTITHDEFLKLTRQVRVVEEAHLMAQLADNPDLAQKIALATKQGSPTVALNLRKE